MTKKSTARKNKSGGARPEGKASPLPAAKKKNNKGAMTAGFSAAAATLAVKAATEKPRKTSGGRMGGVSPAKRSVGGGVNKMPDVLNLKNMNKGGMVTKGKY